VGGPQAGAVQGRCVGDRAAASARDALPGTFTRERSYMRCPASTARLACGAIGDSRGRDGHGSTRVRAATAVVTSSGRLSSEARPFPSVVVAAAAAGERLLTSAELPAPNFRGDVSTA